VCVLSHFFRVQRCSIVAPRARNRFGTGISPTTARRPTGTR
jgi:hypothetical protein